MKMPGRPWDLSVHLPGSEDDAIIPLFSCCQCDFQALILCDLEFIRALNPLPVHGHIPIYGSHVCFPPVSSQTRPLLAQWSRLSLGCKLGLPDPAHFESFSRSLRASCSGFL